jgi:UDP-glucose 4-epimerase
MNLNGKKLLLIGGAGLIGSHTVDQLTREDVSEIRIFDNLSRGRLENLEAAFKDPRVKLFPAGGDILHTDVLGAALDGIDGVFHFAALWLLHCYEYPHSAFDVNIRGTFNVIDACARRRIERVVFSSSASVYGDALTEPMTEEHPFNNDTFYGASKIAGEQMLRSYYAKGKKSGVPFNYAALRYFNVFGPRQDYKGAYVAVIMKMLDRMDAGLPPIIYGDGSQAYDFIYVGDCARANVLAMKAETNDACYNVCTGRKTTLREVAELLFELTGHPKEIQFEPATTSFVKNRLGSAEKAKREIAFEAKTSLREGLKELIEWRSAHKSAHKRRA